MNIDKLKDFCVNEDIYKVLNIVAVNPKIQHIIYNWPLLELYLNGLKFKSPFKLYSSYKIKNDEDIYMYIGCDKYDSYFFIFENGQDLSGILKNNDFINIFYKFTYKIPEKENTKYFNRLKNFIVSLKI